MFYTQLFTSKRGSLAKIWLAAHWERKLTKAHVFECNLETTIREIISPKMKIGLRTSGHLLLGVVRIYSRKAKYLLADCSDALVKVKAAFRPGQTDMTVEGLEATIKAITLIEDFTTFDSQLPDPSDIDVVDHFSLNQSRPEEITLKEDFGKSFLNFEDVGKSWIVLSWPGTFCLDVSYCYFLCLVKRCLLRTDPICFADANTTNSMEVETPTANQTTLLVNDGEAFALEPVPITPNSTRKKGKRKRKLVVDQIKELSNEYIREQLSDFSDLVDSLEMAPPTVQLMQWKESGGAKKLFAQPCSTVLSPQIKEVKPYYIPSNESHNNITRFDEKVPGIVPYLISLSKTLSCSPPDNFQTLDRWQVFISHAVLAVCPASLTEIWCLSYLQSMLNSQDFEERRITRQAQKLLKALKSQSDSSDPTFSLQALCEGSNRWQAATTFFCLLILKKQQVLCLRQHAPYEDIVATPGPKFCN
uniref:RAD21 cohesin complex component like 1 n=1 Tax=Amphilophus citrinellus TaxID=61819 RepID=A0A3Q0RX87_AMPCI